MFRLQLWSSPDLEERTITRGFFKVTETLRNAYTMYKILYQSVFMSDLLRPTCDMPTASQMDWAWIEHGLSMDWASGSWTRRPHVAEYPQRDIGHASPGSCPGAPYLPPLGWAWLGSTHRFCCVSDPGPLAEQTVRSGCENRMPKNPRHAMGSVQMNFHLNESGINWDLPWYPPSLTHGWSDFHRPITEQWGSIFTFSAQSKVTLSRCSNHSVWSAVKAAKDVQLNVVMEKITMYRWVSHCSLHL